MSDAKNSYNILGLSDPDLLRMQCLIAGEWRGSDSSACDVSNPASGELLGTVPDFGAEETNAAIDAAKAAFPIWAKKNTMHLNLLLVMKMK